MSILALTLSSDWFQSLVTNVTPIMLYFVCVFGFPVHYINIGVDIPLDAKAADLRQSIAECCMGEAIIRLNCPRFECYASLGL